MVKIQVRTLSFAVIRPVCASFTYDSTFCRHELGMCEVLLMEMCYRALCIMIVMYSYELMLLVCILA